MTVEFEGEFYQYFKEQDDPPPRRFVYYLRKSPAGRAVVVIDHYHVDDVLKPAAEQWAGTPTFWDKFLPAWNPPQQVPDEIQRATRQSYDLKILSCRPKPDWNADVIIEYQTERYQLLKDERGP